MEQLQFENYEKFVCDIDDTFDNLKEEYGEVSVVAKYNEAKEIITELLCIGYDVASVELHREEFENYFDEYIISLNFDGVWCEKFKRDSGYLNDESNVIYIMNNCSSTVIPYCKSENLYEVSVGNSIEEDSKEHSYMVDGKSVDKATFNNYVSKFVPDLIDKDEDTSDRDDCFIVLNRNIDVHEASEIIRDMEHRMMHMNDMFREMDCFRKLFNW